MVVIVGMALVGARGMTLIYCVAVSYVVYLWRNTKEVIIRSIENAMTDVIVLKRSQTRRPMMAARYSYIRKVKKKKKKHVNSMEKNFNKRRMLWKIGFNLISREDGPECLLK
ncbi:hypothetical protein T4D_8320 [Trichinella pseudospiralis]|uniref:Uncharacterized protein n=1 Tax=Trichinella pseudospiralis TaxID=6337 RepID=A0A0V1G0J9_TRIPS|nr:hypothetical protein T4D_8320 [Trichinella pseudospiralis]